MSRDRRRNSLGCGLAVLALLFLCAAKAAAVPIGQYQQDLKHAIEILEGVEEIDADEGVGDFDSRFREGSDTVRRILPEHESVESGGEVCNVDNSWLHKELKELEQSNDRTTRLVQLVATLRALEQRVAERENPGQIRDSKDQAKSRLENILTRPEYATTPRSSSALARLLEDFARWLQKFLPKRRSVDPGRIDLITFVAEVVVVGLAMLLMLYVIKSLLPLLLRRPRKVKTRKTREPRIVLGERLEPEATATDLLSEAEALARQGDLRAAIRKAYIALLVELGDRKLISLAHYKTNRDYLNSLRGIPQLHSRMRGLTDSFERHWYGFASATTNDWQEFRAGSLAALKSDTN